MMPHFGDINEVCSTVTDRHTHAHTNRTTIPYLSCMHRGLISYANHEHSFNYKLLVITVCDCRMGYYLGCGYKKRWYSFQHTCCGHTNVQADREISSVCHKALWTMQ